MTLSPTHFLLELDHIIYDDLDVLERWIAGDVREMLQSVINRL